MGGQVFTRDDVMAHPSNTIAQVAQMQARLGVLTGAGGGRGSRGTPPRLRANGSSATIVSNAASAMEPGDGLAAISNSRGYGNGNGINTAGVPETSSKPLRRLMHLGAPGTRAGADVSGSQLQSTSGQAAASSKPGPPPPLSPRPRPGGGLSDASGAPARDQVDDGDFYIAGQTSVQRLELALLHLSSSIQIQNQNQTDGLAGGDALAGVTSAIEDAVEQLSASSRLLDPILGSPISGSRLLRAVSSSDQMMTSTMGEGPAAEGFHCLDELSVSALQALFDIVDTDGSGDLSQSEVIKLVKKLGMYTSQEDCDELIRQMDTDNSGSIDFGEFSSSIDLRMERLEIPERI